MIAGVHIFPLSDLVPWFGEDERGWFCEAWRASPGGGWPQLNLSWSRCGTIRGLHWHEGQDDLITCLQGRMRLVLLDPDTDDVSSLLIGGRNRVAVYVPAGVAHGFEALTHCLIMYRTSKWYDPHCPDEKRIRWDDPRVKHLWRTRRPILSKRDAAP